MELELWRGGAGGLARVEQDAAELLECNPVLQRHGLALTEQDARQLALAHRQAAAETGRMVFGQAITARLAVAFCDSPYIGTRDFAAQLAQLTEVFYHFKNETLERLTDEVLVDFMVRAFNGPCQGSLELLMGRELEALAHLARGGEAAAEPDEGDEEEPDE